MLDSNNAQISTGVDIIEIERIKKSIEKNGFLEKYFTKKEISLFTSKKNMASSVAANFAAKEAFSKSIKTGVRGFLLSDVEILRDNLGAPYFNFYNNALKFVNKNSYNFSLSLSHCDTYAIAFVIAYKKKP